jgi:hypothetical protein
VRLRIFDAGILNLFPNPTSGHFSIKMSGEIEGDIKFTVFSISGELIYSEQRQLQSLTEEFYFSEISAGTYILVVTSGDKIIDAKKFIKM